MLLIGATNASTTGTSTTTAKEGHSTTDTTHKASAAHAWGYEENGKNWPKLTMSDNECGGKNQSPINLKNDWTIKPSSGDNFQKMYTDQTENIEVVWNGHTSQVAIDKADQDI